MWGWVCVFWLAESCLILFYLSYNIQIYWAFVFNYFFQVASAYKQVFAVTENTPVC